eukprot:403355832
MSFDNTEDFLLLKAFDSTGQPNHQQFSQTLLKQNSSPQQFKPPSFFLQNSHRNQNQNGIQDTSRTLASSNSQMNLNTIITQTYSTQCDTAHLPQSQQNLLNQTQNPNLSQIKTDLKDKILSTRERFNQLKQRKRQQNSSQNDESANASTTLQIEQPNSSNVLQTNEQGYALGSGSVRNYYSSFRSTSNQNQSNRHHRPDSFNQTSTNIISNVAKKKSYMRENSVESDNIDRDEETFPNINSNTNALQFNQTTNGLKDQIKKVMKNSQAVYKSQNNASNVLNLPSYKLDGAKLIVNRIQVQLKERFQHFCELALSDLNDVNIENENPMTLKHPRVLKEKWKFVRNAMQNMEQLNKTANVTQILSQQKNPLQDRTNNMNIKASPNYIPSSQTNNFTQIQQMFDNFKSMRASSGEGGLTKLKQNQNEVNSSRQLKLQHQPHKSFQESSNKYQENILPVTSSTMDHRVLQQQKDKKVNSKSKDGMILKKKRSDLPPQYNPRMLDKQVRDHSQNHVNFLKSTDQFIVNGITGIGPLEGGDSFSSTYKENEYFISMNQQNTFDKMNSYNMLTTRSNIVLEEETHEGLQSLPLESPMNADKFIIRRQYLKQDQEQLQIKKQQNQYKCLSLLLNVKDKQLIRASFANLKKRSDAHDTLKKLINRKIKEDQIRNHVKSKEAFVRLIKNCLFKNKFEDFIEKTGQRLMEKAFDKIKEYQWITEERKELIEAIFLKQMAKRSFNKWKDLKEKYSTIELMVLSFESQLMYQQTEHVFRTWKLQLKDQKLQDCQIQKLREIIERQQFQKQGFLQFKRNTLHKQKQTDKMLSIVKKYENQSSILEEYNQNQSQNQLAHEVSYEKDEQDLENKFTQSIEHSSSSPNDQQDFSATQILMTQTFGNPLNLKAIADLQNQHNLTDINQLTFALKQNETTATLQHHQVSNFLDYDQNSQLENEPIIQDNSLSQMETLDRKDKHTQSQQQLALQSTHAQKKSLSKKSKKQVRQVSLDLSSLDMHESEGKLQAKVNSFEDSEEKVQKFAQLQNEFINEQVIDQQQLEDEEEFEKLNQIKRISYESGTMGKMIAQQIEFERDMDGSGDQKNSYYQKDFPVLQLNKRGISEIIGGGNNNGGRNGKSVENLRYQ